MWQSLLWQIGMLWKSGATSRVVAPCHPRRKGSSKDGGSRKRLWVSAGHHAALERAMAGWCWHAVPACCKSGNHGDFHNCYIVIPSYYIVTIINMYVSIYINNYIYICIYDVFLCVYIYIYMHIVYIVYCILIKHIYIYSYINSYFTICLAIMWNS